MNSNKSNKRMTLSEAIRSLVEAKGLSILTTPMALNILSDYNAFSEHPSSKNILKNIIAEGYLDKIAFFYDNRLPIGDAPQIYLTELHNKLGFRQDVSAYVLSSILEALGYQSMLTALPETDPSESSDISNHQADDDIENYQNDGTHLEFKGIPITGSPSAFAARLKRFGYVEIDCGEDGVLLNGKFAGIDNCQIIVSSSPYTKNTYCVGVFTPPSLNWWGVKNMYDNMKSMLEKKYGKPYNRQEFFNSPYEEGDGCELSAINSGYAFYATSFQNELGDISIIISGDGKLLIKYEDKINEQVHSELEKLAAEDDL